MIDTKFSETFTDQYCELKDYHCRRQDHNSLKNLPPYSTNPVRDGVFKPEKKLTIVSTHLLPGTSNWPREPRYDYKAKHRRGIIALCAVSLGRGRDDIIRR